MNPQDPRLKRLPTPAPREYSGHWVAWAEDRTEIVAHGTNLEEVIHAAHAVGEDNPVFQKVIGRHFVGRR